MQCGTGSRKKKVEPAELLVVLDDLALPLGTIRMRAKGNDGGHNGLKISMPASGTNAYPRLRCGIGHDFRQGQQVDYVLGEWLPGGEGRRCAASSGWRRRPSCRSEPGGAYHESLQQEGVGAETDKTVLSRPVGDTR